MPKDIATRPVSVHTVIATFWLHTEAYYVGSDGQHTSELDYYRQDRMVVGRRPRR